MVVFTLGAACHNMRLSGSTIWKSSSCMCSEWINCISILLEILCIINKAASKTHNVSNLCQLTKLKLIPTPVLIQNPHCRFRIHAELITVVMELLQCPLDKFVVEHPEPQEVSTEQDLCKRAAQSWGVSWHPQPSPFGHHLASVYNKEAPWRQDNFLSTF